MMFFAEISETVPQFAGLSLNKIGDLGVHILQTEELPPTHPSDEEKSSRRWRCRQDAAASGNSSMKSVKLQLWKPARLQDHDGFFFVITSLLKIVAILCRDFANGFLQRFMRSAR